MTPGAAGWRREWPRLRGCEGRLVGRKGGGLRRSRRRGESRRRIRSQVKGNGLARARAAGHEHAAGPHGAERPPRPRPRCTIPPPNHHHLLLHIECTACLPTPWPHPAPRLGLPAPPSCAGARGEPYLCRPCFARVPRERPVCRPAPFARIQCGDSVGGIDAVCCSRPPPKPASLGYTHARTHTYARTRTRTRAFTASHPALQLERDRLIPPHSAGAH